MAKMQEKISWVEKNWGECFNMARAKKIINLGNVSCVFVNNSDSNNHDKALRYLKFESNKKIISVPIHSSINPIIDGNNLTISSTNKAIQGTIWQMCKNAIQGIEKPYEKTVILRGNGYKANLSGRTLELNLGFSHTVIYNLPDMVDVKIATPRKGDCDLIFSSADNCILGRTAMEIYNMRKPDPYTGKGVILDNKFLIRKKGESGKKK